MFIEMDEKTAIDIAISYISPACTNFQSCDQDLDDRDDILQEFSFPLSCTNYNILIDYMCIQYLDSNYLMTNSALKARLSSSDFHALGLPNMLGKAMELRTMLKSEIDQLAINKSYKDSELFDLTRKRKKV